MDVKQTKISYTISCASAFRDAVEALALKRQVNVGDVARSVLLVLPTSVIDDFPDPGEPASDDRETVILKSGPAEGRPWRRKPRLQVRMAPGYDVLTIRKALGLALALDKGSHVMEVKDVNAPPPPAPQDLAATAQIKEEVERLKAMVNVLSFEPLSSGVATRDEALHVLGFAPHSRPDQRTIRARFRMLATIHHPDSPYGSHHRMSQLNQAMEVLRH